MEIIRKRVRVASNHPIAVYGGHVASRGLLEALVAELRAGGFPMYRGHDITRPFPAFNFDAGIEELEDGYLSVWVEFDIEQEDWVEFEQKLDEIGAPGGFSYSYGEYFALLPPDSNGDVAFTITADAAHFTEDQLSEAAGELAKVGPVKVGHLYQFSYEPPVKVVIELMLDHPTLTFGTAAVTIGVSLFANALYDTLKSLLSRRKRTIFDLITRRYADGSVELMAHLETDNEAVLRDALDKLPWDERSTGTITFDKDSGEWLSP